MWTCRIARVVALPSLFVTHLNLLAFQDRTWVQCRGWSLGTCQCGAKQRAVLFACLYRPPSAPGTQLNANLDQLESELEFMLNQHRGLVVICADTNCDMRYTTGNTTGSQFPPVITFAEVPALPGY